MTVPAELRAQVWLAPAEMAIMGAGGAISVPVVAGSGGGPAIIGGGSGVTPLQAVASRRETSIVTPVIKGHLGCDSGKMVSEVGPHQGFIIGASGQIQEGSR
jgi:hypothetical protein